MTDLIARVFEGPLTSAIRARRLGPDRFDCGVRVLSGTVPGEGRRWRHRASRVEGEVLWHGRRVALRVQIHNEVTHPRGWDIVDEAVVFGGQELDHGARIQIACLPKARKHLEGLRAG